MQHHATVVVECHRVVPDDQVWRVTGEVDVQRVAALFGRLAQVGELRSADVAGVRVRDHEMAAGLRRRAARLPADHHVAAQGRHLRRLHAGAPPPPRACVTAAVPVRHLAPDPHHAAGDVHDPEIVVDLIGRTPGRRDHDPVARPPGDARGGPHPQVVGRNGLRRVHLHLDEPDTRPALQLEVDAAPLRAPAVKLQEADSPQPSPARLAEGALVGAHGAAAQPALPARPVADDDPRLLQGLGRARRADVS
mmetsp:Transcript_135846/g.422007  ORF Transcript_135846/g.422007 Transcript_135846/m.422007 type:complete len:250 (-) Transcript_135846:806-1555(-)